MAEEGFKRKLAAILSADLEGYSRFMDQDDEATIVFILLPCSLVSIKLFSHTISLY